MYRSIITQLKINMNRATSPTMIKMLVLVFIIGTIRANSQPLIAEDRM